MKKIVWVMVILVLLIVFGLWQWPDGRLRVIFCDVGQGDAQLVVLGQIQVLIDGGPDEKVLECLGRHVPFWDRRIEMVVGTHPDKDHIGGLIEVLERYEVGMVLVGETVDESQAAKQFGQLLEGRQRHVPVRGERIEVGDLGFEILWPPARVTLVGESNAGSVVMELKFGEFEVLFTGDIGEKEEGEIANLGEVEILKVAHHGSKYSSGGEFLEKVRPKLSVIGVGKKNRYGHPTEEVLERLQAVGSKVLRTDIDGEVEVVSDGNKWWVKG